MTTSALTGRVSDHLWPIVLCGIVATVFFALVFQQSPMIPSGGKISPVGENDVAINRPVIPGDKVEVSWIQDWNKLCPITITATITGADGFPKSQIPIILQPPKETGIIPPEKAHRYFTFPYLVAGNATYKAKLEPNCFIDNIWQRQFETATINFQVGKVSIKPERASGVVNGTK